MHLHQPPLALLAGAPRWRVSILRGLDCLREVPSRHRRNAGRVRDP